jgi:hypothetical protein
VLSVLGVAAAFTTRRRRASRAAASPPDNPAGRRGGQLLRNLSVGLIAASAVGAVLRKLAGDELVERCTAEREISLNVCRQREDRGYNRCDRYEDQGYNRCDRWEDQGYQACSDWRKNCCDWWPCSWVCEVFSWVCVAFVWISNIVCVVWTWISNVVCVLWVWVSNIVCVAWAIITFPICILRCLIPKALAGNEVSEGRSECIYGWTAAYRITEERDCELLIVVRIRLNPDAGVNANDLQNARNTWEQAVEQAWTNKFPIRRTSGPCRCESYRVRVDLQWVTSGEHHTVRVRTGSGRADMTNWFITGTGGTAAHEVGHMFGNPDEYPDPACPSRVASNDGSIMRSSQTGTVRPRHYQGFADWISRQTCCTYEVAER